MKRLIKSTLSFLQTLFRARDPIISYSNSDRSILKGWEGDPEEKILQSVDTIFAKEQVPPFAILLGLEGNHKTELHLLTQSKTTIGLSWRDDLVITPKGIDRPSKFVILKEDGKTRIRADGLGFFLLNDKETAEAEIFDYDRLSIMGNNFLYMENIHEYS